jgi:hypothetical protein
MCKDIQASPKDGEIPFLSRILQLQSRQGILGKNVIKVFHLSAV